MLTNVLGLGSAVGFWSTLIDCGITYKSLLALIFYLLDRKNQVYIPYTYTCSISKMTYVYMLTLNIQVISVGTIMMCMDV